MFDHIKCVTFDLDDTLWPVEPTITKAEQAVYDWMRKHYPMVTEKYSPIQIAEKRSVLIQTRVDIAHNVTELRYCALYELANEFGFDREFCDAAIAVFRKHRNDVQPYPHSEDLLSYLQKRYIVGAITNGNAQLDKIALGKFFDFVVTAEEVGASKPNAEIFIFASKLANVDLQEIIHIGDSPQADVIGALSAGCKAIWFNPNRMPWPGGQTPDKVVHCLSELPQLLDN